MTSLGTYGGSGSGSTGGGNPFGTKPKPIAMPNPAGDLAAQYPQLGATNEQLSNTILSQLRGELSPDTIAQIQDAAATFGITSGMPGAGLQQNLSLRDIGRTSQQVQQQGLENYGRTIPVISGTQTVSPELQYDVNTQNALWAAAPDPSAAALRAEEMYNKYLNSLKGPAGGTGGGTGPAPNPIRSLIGYTSHGVGGTSERFV